MSFITPDCYSHLSFVSAVLPCEIEMEDKHLPTWTQADQSGRAPRLGGRLLGLPVVMVADFSWRMVVSAVFSMSVMLVSVRVIMGVVVVMIMVVAMVVAVVMFVAVFMVMVMIVAVFVAVFVVMVMIVVVFVAMIVVVTMVMSVRGCLFRFLFLDPCDLGFRGCHVAPVLPLCVESSK